jgi:ribosomal protein S6--L-glutamate ligase
VNSSPGLEGIERATGKDIAGAIIQYMEKDSLKGPNKMKGKG